MDAALERYLAGLVEVARAVVGDDLRGAYAAGSVALGAYQPGRSDVDVALVCDTSPAAEVKRELVARLRHEALPCPARGLELVLYRAAVAGSGTAAAGFELELNSGPGMAFRATYHPDDRPLGDGHFWYGLDRSILAQHGRALLGPPAAEVFVDLRDGDLRELLVQALRWWLARPVPVDGPAPGAEDAVLGACRSWARLRTGRWLAKEDAGRWFVADGGSADLVERCLRARHGGPAPTGSEARAFQLRVLQAVEQGAGTL